MIKKIKSEQFIFVINKIGSSPYLFYDLYSDERAVVLKGFLKNIRNPIIKGIRKVHLSKKINSQINLPFKNVWGCSLREIHWDYNLKYYVILLGSSLWPIDYTYLLKIKKEYNVKFILLMLDPWESDRMSASARKYADVIKFDYIFSFDPSDVKKYNFIYEDAPYSIIYDSKPCMIENDIYLAANAAIRGGAGLFHRIYADMKRYCLKANYRLINVPNKDQKFKNEIIYNQYIQYPEVVKEVIRSNCILEVLSTGQSGATNRYHEAICYNKKLLTNNKNIVNLPFYNPDYIHVFEKPEDIDWEWVKERIPVDYHYDGRFSPTHLIDKIIELEEEREKKENGEKEDN